jgi:predicted RNase H-like nuclease (RuvC/YqgF family)
VYGKEAIVPLEFLVPSLRVAVITNMKERGAIKERLNQLMEMEDDMILEGFHQEVQKARDKSWHERHTKRNIFKEGDLVLLYDSKFGIHWLVSYEVNTIMNGGFV